MKVPQHSAQPTNPFDLLRRRWFFEECGVGLGAIALGHLLGEGGSARAADSSANLGGTNSNLASSVAPSSGGVRSRTRQPHFAPRAKRVIYLFMAGAPSHLELFDNKPELARWDGKLPPAELIKGYRTAFINASSRLLGPRFKFRRHGESGIELSEMLPHLGSVIDDVALVKAMHTEAVNHAPGQIMMNTGSQQFGRPCLGSWVTYGLGSETSNLPAYVVFSTGRNGPSGGSSNWGAGFLPSSYQGVLFRNVGEPVLSLTNPPGIDRAAQRDTLDVIRQLNERRLQIVGDPEIATRVDSFEMAYRMQASAPELVDLSNEPKHILDMYGVTSGKPSFASSCLMARRLVERGVRFVQIFHEAWDHHSGLSAGIKAQAGETDKPAAALIRDLKQRGMLEDTLVIWGGEFGRTPMAQMGDGRDHHANCFTTWLSGGGIKGGITYGESDDFGFHGTKNRVHVNDLHATILHLLGFDHTRLTHRFQGRDFRLTDVAGNVVRSLLS